jgi:hypothetical protein
VYIQSLPTVPETLRLRSIYQHGGYFVTKTNIRLHIRSIFNATAFVFVMESNSLISVPDNSSLGSSTVVGRDGWPNKEDWATHRSTIKRLYLYENKTLKEVMEIMNREYLVKATLVASRSVNV